MDIGPLRMAHLEADHRLAAGDTSDLLPGIDPTKAVETARRIISSDYHLGCPLCAGPAQVWCDKCPAEAEREVEIVGGLLSLCIKHLGAFLYANAR